MTIGGPLRALHKIGCSSVLLILVIRVLLQGHSLFVASMSMDRVEQHQSKSALHVQTATSHSQPATSSEHLNFATTSTTTPTTATSNISGVASSSPVHQQVGTLSQPYCTLGDETFQIGERWNPDLPPFGVHVCVLCECIVRQRKACYEAKVTCRRITDECPVVESCPDGKKPVTVAGQCCKSCQSTAAVAPQQPQQQQQEGPQQSPAYEQAAPALQQQAATKSARTQQFPLQTPSIMAFKIVYMDERTKEYLSMVKSLPACSPLGEAERQNLPPSNSNQPLQKSSKSNSRNTMNGIDTRWAFKSLSESAPANQVSGPTKTQSPEFGGDGDSSASRAVSNGSDHQHQEDSLRHDHQHPNDVQSTKQSQGGATSLQAITSSIQNRRTNNGSETSSADQQSFGACSLGDEKFQVGDQWNPILPPLGVQVCVLCECGFKVKKNCYEPKLDCRRINKDCPATEICPDGKRPVSVAGQCCKTCQGTGAEQQDQQLEPTKGVITSGSNLTSISATQNLHTQESGVPQRNEKIYRDFQTISKSLGICSKRESAEANGARSRFAKSQSKRATARHNLSRQAGSNQRKL